MRDDSGPNPMRAAQAHMRPAPVRRFYDAVEVRAAGGQHELMLDGRAARTPARNRLRGSSRRLMERVAEEWARQREMLDPADMPLTRLVNAAIDGVAGKMEETRAEIAVYAGSDLLYYRAEAPEALAERQRLAFDPALEWAERTFGARFRLAAGVMHVAQPPPALEALRAAIDAFDEPAALAALSAMTTLTGSALLALAVARGFLTPEAAWSAAHVDEDYQNELWGVDAEALARRAARWREMEAAASALEAMRSESNPLARQAR